MLEFISLRIRNVPRNPEEVFEPFTAEMKTMIGDDLISLAVFGSAASGDYIYGHSNINIVMILKRVPVGLLKKLALPMEKWMTRGFDAPRIFTPQDLERSLDSFPVLFLDIRDNHRVLHGNDLLHQLVIDSGLLRVQVEQMLKKMVADIRTEFLKSGESLKTFEGMITRTFNDLYPLLRALLVLKVQKTSVRKEVVVAQAEEVFGLDRGVLVDALRHKMGTIRISELYNLLAYFERYLAAIEKLADIADRLESIR